MKENEILIEKDKVQKKLSESCTDIHDYFIKAHESAEQLSKKYGVTLRYQQLPDQKIKIASKHTPQTAHREEEVDGTLIQWMLSMTPDERLRTLNQNVRSIVRLRNAKSHS